ncbi:MAG: hypothetical protein NC331_16105 [Lachnospiraceae bacterium]|nr:hypothetical protein [Lachnospiraceae bacterium]MCM1240876.1 hypothetical protein [Lachnospiraceae bacterium]
MRTKKKQKYNMWSDEKKLKRVAFLLYENYEVSQKELEECKRIIEDLQESAQNSAG